MRASHRSASAPSSPNSRDTRLRLLPTATASPTLTTASATAVSLRLPRCPPSFDCLSPARHLHHHHHHHRRLLRPARPHPHPHRPQHRRDSASRCFAHLTTPAVHDAWCFDIFAFHGNNLNRSRIEQQGHPYCRPTTVRPPSCPTTTLDSLSPSWLFAPGAHRSSAPHARSRTRSPVPKSCCLAIVQAPPYWTSNARQ